MRGTFADNTDDAGPRWWYGGSENWTWFADNLPEGVCLPDESSMHLKCYECYDKNKPVISVKAQIDAEARR